MKLKRWHLESQDGETVDGYWASYSDLMAGILLVFAVAATFTWIEFNRNVIESTLVLDEWRQFLETVCKDPGLKSDNTRVDCETGILILSDEALRFERGSADLSEAGRQLLVDTVPMYLHVYEIAMNKYEGLGARITGIEVSGHTDSTGNYGVNNYISRERAGRVLAFLTGTEQEDNDAPLDRPSVQGCPLVLGDYRQFLKQCGYSAGYANRRPPNTDTEPDEQVNWPDARRIEIQIQFDHAGILSEVKQQLDRAQGRQ